MENQALELLATWISRFEMNVIFVKRAQFGDIILYLFILHFFFFSADGVFNLSLGYAIIWKFQLIVVQAHACF
jgi:hypothetical protein